MPDAVRELDDEVGRKIMGIILNDPFPYSSDIGEAWRVVERLRQQGWIVRVQEMPEGLPFLGPEDMNPQPKDYRKAACMLYWRGESQSLRRYPQPFAIAASAPEAICLAALQTVNLKGEIE